jgi:hypothetical protein
MNMKIASLPSQKVSLLPPVCVNTGLHSDTSRVRPSLPPFSFGLICNPGFEDLFRCGNHSRPSFTFYFDTRTPPPLVLLHFHARRRRVHPPHSFVPVSMREGQADKTKHLLLALRHRLQNTSTVPKSVRQYSLTKLAQLG